MHSKEFLSLVEKSDTKITIKATNVNDGAPYVEKFQTWVKWEILTPDPRSKQVAVRQTYNVHWFSKPMIVAGYVES